MKRTLVVGCSFLSTLPCDDPANDWFLDHERFKVSASAGSGNQAMANRVLYECANQKFQEVIVVWSGIRRLDVPIPLAVFESWPRSGDNDPHWSFNAPLRNIVLSHSGGQAGAWTWDRSCPKILRNWFHTQYLADDSPYFTDMSLISIAQTQCFLHSQDIPYRMAFAYDITKGDDGQHAHCFGYLDHSSIYDQFVDWSKISTDRPLFEWAHRDLKRIDKDGFHPTREAVRAWFDLTFGVDLAS